MLAKIILAFYN